jgi:sphingolipid delta-4 desaturase
MPNAYKHDFYRVSSKEPHRARGIHILKNYPSAKNLLGPNVWTIFCMLIVVALQTGLAIQMSSYPLWMIVIVSWVFGAILNHAVFVLIHDATHNLIFKRTWANRAAAIFANLPIGVPMAMAFRTFHLLHHAHQGNPEFDADLPTEAEAKLVGNSPVRKALWLLTFLLNESFYRPRAITHNKTPLLWVLLNYVSVIIYCGALIYFFGVQTYLYFFLSTLFSVGLHPLGARWIQEHFVVRPGQETYSYYGPFNHVMFNVGYHNEHHDLPYVAWNRLPALKRLAPEMYDTLYSHQSYWSLLRQFIFDPSIGMHSRVVRTQSMEIKTPQGEQALTVEVGAGALNANL